MMCPPQAVHATTTTLLSRHLEEKSGLSRSLCRCEEKIMLPCHAMSTFSRGNRFSGTSWTVLKYFLA